MESSLGRKRLGGCDQRELPVGGDLEEAEGCVCPDAQRSSLVKEKTTHMQIQGGQSMQPGSRKQSWVGHDISQILWTQTQRPAHV